MDQGFHEHREVVLGVGALALGVFWAADSMMWSAVVFGLVMIGFVRLKAPRALVLLLLLAFGLGVFRYSLALTSYTAKSYNEAPIEIEGVVADYPDVREDRIKLTIETHPREPLILVTVNRYPEYDYGDRLRFYGVLEAPAEFDDFSYKNYLRRYGIDSVMYNPSVELIEASTRRDWKYWIFLVKANVEARLNRLFPEPYASFSAGLLLGSRRGIPEELMENFNTSGLTHIIAISGYNITLIIVFVSGLFRFLSRRWQTIVATVIIGIFVVLVGATAAVVRAAIMGVLALWAVWFGRRSEVTRLLALTAGGMTLWNPFILVDDVGFQLSFAATCGLVYMTPTVEKFLEWGRIYHRIPELFSIREAFVTTLAAQTFAVPIIIANFGRLSLIAPFSNVAVVSFIPLAMMFSFLALLVSYTWWNGGLLIAYVAWFFLELIIQIASWSAEMPFASIG